MSKADEFKDAFGRCGSETEARKEFRRLAGIYHPDKGGDPADFVALSVAFANSIVCEDYVPDPRQMPSRVEVRGKWWKVVEKRGKYLTLRREQSTFGDGNPKVIEIEATTSEVTDSSCGPGSAYKIVSRYSWQRDRAKKWRAQNRKTNRST